LLILIYLLLVRVAISLEQNNSKETEKKITFVLSDIKFMALFAISISVIVISISYGIEKLINLL
jgi:hypothetical protein